MLDYPNTEFVLYADTPADTNVITIEYYGDDYIFYKDDLLPEVISINPTTDMYYVCSYNELIDHTHGLDFSLAYDYTSYNADSNIKNYVNSLFNTELYTPSIVSTSICDCYISGYGYNTRYGNEVYKVSKTDSIINYGFGPYIRVKVKSRVGQSVDYYAWVRVPMDYLPDNYSSPFDSLTFIGGTDIYWLYNFGSSIIGSSSVINTILNYRIGDYNLVTLLFGGGFVIYLGWVVIKWIIPV